MHSRIILLRQVDKQKLKSSLRKALFCLTVFTRKNSTHMFYNSFNIPHFSFCLCTISIPHPLAHSCSFHNSIESSHETVNKIYILKTSTYNIHGGVDLLRTLCKFVRLLAVVKDNGKGCRLNHESNYKRCNMKVLLLNFELLLYLPCFCVCV